jgi:hypothetical protein
MVYGSPEEYATAYSDFENSEFEGIILYTQKNTPIF